MYQLSKSTYIRSLQCHKSLWLYKKRGDLRDKISPEQQIIFSRGHFVGALAQQLFPNGVDVAWDSPLQYKLSVDKTKEAIQNGVSIIYEAAFLVDDVLIAIDILVKDNQTNQWIAYEVKSSLKVSETYKKDAALQMAIINRSGLITLSNFFIITLNRDYIRGAELDIQGLFAYTSVYQEINSVQDSVWEKIEEAKQVLSFNNEPSKQIGTHCKDPYPCDYLGYCWKGFLESTVFSLPSMPDSTRWEYFNQNNIQLSNLDDNRLTNKEQIEKHSLILNQPYLDKPQLQSFLSGIKFPHIFIYPLSVRPAIPLFQGTKPYQKITVGYASIYQESSDSKPVLKSFLAKNQDEFQADFIQEIMNSLSTDTQILMFINGGFDTLNRPTLFLKQIIEQRIFWHPAFGSDVSLLDVMKAIPIPMNTQTPLSSEEVASDLYINQILNPSLLSDFDTISAFMGYQSAILYRFTSYLQKLLT